MSCLIKLVIILIYMSKPCVLEEAPSHMGKEAGTQPTSSHLWDIFRSYRLVSPPLLQCFILVLLLPVESKPDTTVPGKNPALPFFLYTERVLAKGNKKYVKKILLGTRPGKEDSRRLI